METQRLSRYLDYLPAYLQTDAFLGRFLLAFEKVLSGFSEEEIPFFQPQILSGVGDRSIGLETLISQIHTYFDPQQTPSEFLPWLAGWVALSLREDWDEKVKRNFISQIVPLYHLRGTVPGLKKMLQIYLENSGLSYPERTISIFEFDDYPHYFQVQLVLPSNQVLQPDRYWQECRAAKAIIDHEKPAHTFYALRILTLTLQITKTWGGSYPFTLFDAPPHQSAVIEAKITLDAPDLHEKLDSQILIRLQGKNSVLAPGGSQRGPIVRQTISYATLMANPDGFFVALANLSDRPLSGTLSLTLYFQLNRQPFSHTILESRFDLEPNLRLYRPWNAIAAMTGNTHLDAELEKTLQLPTDAPVRLYQAHRQRIDGNTRIGHQVGQTLRLVHDARLRLYQSRTRFDRMEGSTRLGTSVGQTLRLPLDRQNPKLKIYQRSQDHPVGNTRLGEEIGQTLRLIPNSAWLERLYRFQLFDTPETRSATVEVLVEPTGIPPGDIPKVTRLLVLRMQSCTSTLKPFMPKLEFVPEGLRATHHISYERFLRNPQGFYVVLTNINDCTIEGKITITLHFRLNQRPCAIVIFTDQVSLMPRDNVLEMCQLQPEGQLRGNTILGRLTPYMREAAAVEEEIWVD